LPSGLAVGLTLVLALRLPPDALGSQWLSLLPFPVFAAALWLAWRFQRSRSAQIAILLLVSWLVCCWPPLSGLLSQEKAITNDLFAALIPLVLGLLCWLRDRGCTSRRATLGFLWIGIPTYALLVWVPDESLKSVMDTIDTQLRASPWPGDLALITNNRFSVRPLVAFSSAFAALSLCLCFYRRRSQIEVGFFWILNLGVLALASDELGLEAGSVTLFFSAAGVVLFLSMVEQFHGLAYRDELTGLLSRRALQDKLSGLGRSYSLAMVDIDHFKRFNDRFGHDAGDELLRLVAVQLQATGGGSTAYRYGGEEFTLVFPGKSKEDAAPFLEALRGAIKEKRFTPRHWSRPRKKPTRGKKRRNAQKKSVGVTVSIGCSAASSSMFSPDEVLKSADQALYRAKRAGRNRVVIK